MNIFGDPDINNLLIIVVLTCLIVGTGIRGIVYKNTLFHVTEMSFISNLMVGQSTMGIDQLETQLLDKLL